MRLLLLDALMADTLRPPNFAILASRLFAGFGEHSKDVFPRFRPDFSILLQRATQGYNCAHR